MAEQEPRQHLVDQRASNAQTVAFVADQQATIADQAEALAREHPELQGVADRERANRDRLQRVADREGEVATQILFETADELSLAAQVREHRMELLEVARAEERIADELEAREQADPTVEALVEQARRNRDLLRHVASTERAASVALRGAEATAGEAEEGPWAPGACVSGAALASGLGIGSAMAMLEAAQELDLADEAEA
jgi:hypothetical protein